jgi:hypothetical protein
MLIRSKLSFILTVSGIFLYPGLNEVSDVNGEKIVSNDYFKDFQKVGNLEVIEVDSVDKNETDEDDDNKDHPIVSTIFSSSTEDAVELIEELFIIGELRLLVEKETARKPKRKKVIDALNRQIAKLTEDRKTKVENE